MAAAAAVGASGGHAQGDRSSSGIVAQVALDAATVAAMQQVVGGRREGTCLGFVSLTDVRHLSQGADRETAEAMSAQFAAMLNDPNTAAAAMTVMTDPSHPANMQLMAQLAQVTTACPALHVKCPPLTPLSLSRLAPAATQMTGHLSLPGSSVADSFQALVAAAAGAYEMDGGEERKESAPISTRESVDAQCVT